MLIIGYSVFILFIHSTNLSTYYRPGTVLDTEATEVNKILAFMEVTF
jgi:hypothetical protein